MTEDEKTTLLAQIEMMLDDRADGQYGLHDITQKQHALQSAWLAERDGHPAALIAAALMHDIGHLVHNPGDDPAAQGIDDQHEDVGNEWLARAFGRT
jgi:predicted HD phosphohydrolase